jgi:adenosylcobinamide-phosphate synthase
LMRRRARWIAAALLVDAALGEPPERVHPVVWMGKTISAFESFAGGLRTPRTRLGAGLLVASGLPLLAFYSTHALLKALPAGLRDVVEVALISTSLSMHGLGQAARAVEYELGRGNLATARARAGEMVGRDTDHLGEGEIARAAVESVAENTSDGVVAPAVYAYAFGAPGALAYKAVNTLDSMIGHPDEPYRHLGWASARLDDAANFVPARLTALAVAAVSGRPLQVVRISSRYGSLTSSPNAGWAEAAFAGALGLRLGGTNRYGGVERAGPRLGDGRQPETGDVGRAVAVMRRSCLLLVAGALVLGESA